MRMRAGFAAATSMMALATGASACTEVDPTHQVDERLYDTGHFVTGAAPDHMIITDTEKRRLHESYAQIVRYGGESVTARLVLVEGREEIVCYDAIVAKGMVTSRDGAKYCRQPDEVVITGGWMRIVIPELGDGVGDVEDAAIEWTQAHEVGHSKQLGTLENADEVTREYRADCFAGRIMGTLVRRGLRAKKYITDTKTAIMRLEEDELHPSNERRLKSYMTGVNGGDCSQISAQ